MLRHQDFTSNSKLFLGGFCGVGHPALPRRYRKGVGEELRKGRSAALILQAANYIGRSLPDRDQIPGLTLADNLAATIIATELEQAAAGRRERTAGPCGEG
jgi:hypothetical protein